jgi:LmbE family N-acetylglucosaminyl deacetylase
MSELLTDRGPRPVPTSALVVCAHPDDVDFGAGGTVAALTAAGTTVSYCLATSGEAGSDHLPLDADELRALREKEQTEAASRLGVSDLAFLGFPDGRLEATVALRGAITAEIRRTRPELVICQSPERMLTRIFASHPDHLAAGEATLCAVYPDSRNPRSFPEQLADGLEPHTVGEVWLMAHPDPDLRIDVTETFGHKVDALRAHESQTGHRDDLEEMLRTWLRAGAEAGGLPDGRLAESFKVIPTA